MEKIKILKWCFVEGSPEKTYDRLLSLSTNTEVSDVVADFIVPGCWEASYNKVKEALVALGQKRRPVFELPKIIKLIKDGYKKITRR
jgi:hypothetical protein